MDKEIEKALELLWSIKDGDKFYFMEYGADYLKTLIKEATK